MNNKIVMGLDQSLTSTGVAVRTKDIVIHHERIATTKDLPKLERMRYIAYQVAYLVQTLSVDTIVIETLALGAAGDATRDLAGLFWVLKHIIDDQCPNVVFEEVAPNSLKKLATGNGRAKKDEMIDSLPPVEKDIAESYLKTKGRSDIADALHLAATSFDMERPDRYMPVRVEPREDS